MKRLAVWAGLAGLALAIAVAAGALWLHRHVEAPLRLGPEGQLLEVAAGSSLRSVARQLRERQWLDSARAFVWYARLRGDSGHIRAGEYELEPGTSAAALLDQLVAGKVLLHSLTVIEGWTFRQLRAALGAHRAVTETLTALSDEQVMARLGRAGEHPEGRFFPDTYRFPRGTTDQAVLERAFETMDEQLAEMWSGRDLELPLRTPYEALILASIVEKETALDIERARIAGVFMNRLRKDMRLQTDPTVIYGLGESFDGNLRRRDLERDTPYNTYTRKGLPPTPIALAGSASLQAVLHPQQTDALYFVATGEADGSHYFSATLAEHNRAVQRYLARLRGRVP